MPTPLVLISNDDGFRSDGIRALVASLRKVGRVVVVAPDGEQSASSHSLTVKRPLRVYHRGPDEYSVDGTPTDCLMMAVHEVLPRKPDLVVSGINHGANLGDDVHYSGTVSAAVEGALMGIPALAFSLVAWGDGRKYFETAGEFAAKLSRKVLSEGLPQGSLLNINVPNFPAKKIKGHAFTHLGKRNYGNIIFEKIDPRGKKYYWIGGDDRSFEDVSGSDGNTVLEKKISITPLQVDPTHYSLLEKIKYWKL